MDRSKKIKRTPVRKLLVTVGRKNSLITTGSSRNWLVEGSHLPGLVGIRKRRDMTYNTDV